MNARAERPADGGEGRLAEILWASPLLDTLFRRWPDIGLPDGWLSGSAITQAVWNAAFGFPQNHGLADLDLVYFDPDDLTEAREVARGAQVRALFPDLPIWIDAKNEARVHLWYERTFGSAIEPYRSIGEAISTFPTTAAAVAVRPGAAGLEIFAPFGLSDLLACIVRANRTQITQALYDRKIARWRELWPDLSIIAWDDGPVVSRSR